MFQVRLTVLLVLVVVIMVLGGWTLRNHGQSEQLETDVKPALKVSLESFRLLHTERMSRAERFLGSVSQSKLPSLLTLVASYKRQFQDLRTRVRAKYGSLAGQDPRASQWVPEMVRLNPDIFRKVKGDLAALLDGEPEKDVLTNRLAHVFSSCGFNDNSYDECFFKFFWAEFFTRYLADEDNRKHLPELMVILDSDDKTARIIYENLPQFTERFFAEKLEKAEREQMEVSAYSRYADQVQFGFNARCPAIDVVARGEAQQATSYLELGDSVYAVVVRRLGAPGGAGPIALAGYQLDNRRATEDAARVVGMRPGLLACLDEANSGDLSETRCDYERSLQTKGISFFFRGSSATTYTRVGTSLGERAGEDLVSACRIDSDSCPPTEGCFLQSGDLVAVSGTVPLEVQPGAATIRAVVSTSLSAELGAHDTMFLYIAVFGLVALIVGVIMMLVLARHLNKPFEEMERVANSVIGGSFDVDFPYHFDEPVPRAMGQTLTIMKAVLLGQPIPEESERDQSWGDAMGLKGMDSLEDDEERSSDGPERLEELEYADAPDNPTEYYNRLFKEYVEARRSLGISVDGITYVKFVEKAARVEKSLRERLGLKRVVLKVSIRGDQVVLVPYRVREEA